MKTVWSFTDIHFIGKCLFRASNSDSNCFLSWTQHALATRCKGVEEAEKAALLCYVSLSLQKGQNKSRYTCVKIITFPRAAVNAPSPSPSSNPSPSHRPIAHSQQPPQAQRWASISVGHVCRQVRKISSWISASFVSLSLSLSFSHCCCSSKQCHIFSPFIRAQTMAKRSTLVGH